MLILTNLILDGWIIAERERAGAPPPPTLDSLPTPSTGSTNGRASTDGSGSIIVNGYLSQPTPASNLSTGGNSVRPPSEILSQRRGHSRNGGRTNFNFSAFLAANGFSSHRSDLTMSSPARLPPPIETDHEHVGLAVPDRDLRQLQGPYSS